MTRTKKLAKNSIFGLISFIGIAVLSFVIRRFFVQSFGFEVLGLKTVLISIIGTMSLVELGIGMAIVFSLYKPLEEKDEKKIAILIKLYKKIFYIIALIVFVVGLILLPLLPLIVGSGFSFLDIFWPYLIFLFGSVATYIFSFNHILLAADQRPYIVSIINIATKLVVAGFQLLILFIFPNFILFVATGVAFTFIGNIILAIWVRKLYPYLIKKETEKLPASEKEVIKTKMKALVFHKIGNFLVSGMDSIIISIFLMVAIVGKFSNYLLISSQIVLLISALFSGLGASFGSVLASSTTEKTKQVFKNARQLYFIIFAVLATGIFVLTNQFLVLWIGEEALLPWYFVLVWVVNIFLVGYSEPLGLLRFAAGVFEPDRYLHIALPFIKLAVAIPLVYFIGITGVLLGTTVCLIVKEIAILPRITYKHIFQEKERQYLEYYKRMSIDFAVVAGIVAACFFLNQLINTGILWLDFILGGLMCVSICLLVLFVVYFRTKEMNYIFGLARRVFKKENKEEESMTFIKTKLEGCIEIAPKNFEDSRGWFVETYNKEVFDKNGVEYDFVQDNHSYSKDKGTIRGLHMQNPPYAQAKLVRCVRGAIFDVAVDLRTDSPTYKEWVGVELSAENQKMLMIPQGFAHGFVTLADDTEVCYKVDNHYNKDSEVGILYSDPDIGVEWNVVEPVLSDKDKMAKLLRDCNIIQATSKEAETEEDKEII